MRTEPYNREAAADYAKKWALLRNPRYLNFDGMGGDCTSFASQCLYAGSGVMNYTKDVGWYYNSSTDRAAAWSGAQYLNRFLLNNRQVGPTAKATAPEEVEIGDLIQLFNGSIYYHSLVVAEFSREGVPLVCTHTQDAYLRPLDTYYYISAQGLHITGVNRW